MTTGQTIRKKALLLASLLALGAAISIGIALCAALREPINVFSPKMFTKAIPAPQKFGRGTIEGYIWGYGDTHRPAERTMYAILNPADKFPPIEPRPALPAAISAFLDEEWGAPAAPGASRGNFVAVRATGWPLVCLWYGYGVNPPAAGTPNWSGDIYGGWRLASQTPLARALPLRPIWPNLVINSMVWAGVLVAIPWTVSRVRAILRRTRGECARCGYDLKSHAPDAACPECGHQRPRMA